MLARKLKQLQVKRRREEKETGDGLNKRSHVKRDDPEQTAAAAATSSAAPPTAAPVVAAATSSATSAAPALTGMHSCEALYGLHVLSTVDEN